MTTDVDLKSTTVLLSPLLEELSISVGGHLVDSSLRASRAGQINQLELLKASDRW